MNRSIILSFLYLSSIAFFIEISLLKALKMRSVFKLEIRRRIIQLRRQWSNLWLRVFFDHPLLPPEKIYTEHFCTTRSWPNVGRRGEEAFIQSVLLCHSKRSKRVTNFDSFLFNLFAPSRHIWTETALSYRAQSSFLGYFFGSRRLGIISTMRSSKIVPVKVNLAKDRIESWSQIVRGIFL